MSWIYYRKRQSFSQIIKKSDIVVRTAARIQQPVYLRNGLIRYNRFLSSTLLLWVKYQKSYSQSVCSTLRKLLYTYFSFPVHEKVYFNHAGNHRVSIISNFSSQSQLLKISYPSYVQGAKQWGTSPRSGEKKRSPKLETRISYTSSLGNFPSRPVQQIISKKLAQG